jgi:cell wall assembly regulator SMI1
VGIDSPDTQPVQQLPAQLGKSKRERARDEHSKSRPRPGRPADCYYPAMTRAVTAAWERIRGWVEEQADAPESLGPGATPEQIAKLEANIGATLPADLTALLELHDGDAVTLHSWLQLLAVDHIAAEISNAHEWAARARCLEVAGPVEPVAWHPGWFPFAILYGASLLHCVDTAPAKGGSVGQVIFVNLEDGERRVIAPSLSAYLERFAASLEDGSMTWFEGAIARHDDEEGCFWERDGYQHSKTRSVFLTATDSEIEELVAAMAKNPQEIGSAISDAMMHVYEKKWDPALRLFKAAVASGWPERAGEHFDSSPHLSRAWAAMLLWRDGQRETAASVLPTVKDPKDAEAVIAELRRENASWELRRHMLDRLPPPKGKTRLFDIEARWQTGDRDTARSRLIECVDEWIQPLKSPGTFNAVVDKKTLLRLLESFIPDDPAMNELRDRVRAAPEPEWDTSDPDFF